MRSVNRIFGKMFGISDWPRPFSPEINKKASHQPTTYFKMAAKEIHPRKMIFIPPLILKGCESHVTIYVFESKSLVLDLINDNQVIGFLSKTAFA